MHPTLEETRRNRCNVTDDADTLFTLSLQHILIYWDENDKLGNSVTAILGVGYS